MSFITPPSKTDPINKIFGVSGSPRRNGNSDIILDAILTGADREKISSRRINLSSVNFQGCIGCEKCRKDKICTGLIDGMSVLYQDILSSKGLVLVSPTHNYNITSWMKAFIDRLYCFYNFQGDRPGNWSSQIAGQNRKAIIAAICEQENKADMGFTLDAMKKPLEALGFEIAGELAVYKIFDKAKVKKEKQTILKAHALGATLAKDLKHSYTRTAPLQQ